MRSRRLVWVAAGLAFAGCHKPPARVRQVRPPLVFAKPEPAPPPELPEAPSIASAPAVPDLPLRWGAILPAPPPPAPKKAAAAATKKPEVKTEATVLPRLGELLTEAQILDYTRRYEAAISRAGAALALIARRPLTANQRADADRVRTFLAQAEQERRSDLAHAVNLAERADLLAKSLLSR